MTEIAVTTKAKESENQLDPYAELLEKAGITLIEETKKEIKMTLEAGSMMHVHCDCVNHRPCPQFT